MTLNLVDKNAHFVSSPCSTLIMPCADNAISTSSLTTTLEEATCPTAQKVATAKDRWPYADGGLLLL
jgi:hypothetical protein